VRFRSNTGDSNVPFANRREAGLELAGKLGQYKDRANAIVFALPRGGVPVAFEIATALRLPLDIFVVRKIGMPGHSEFAIGAIASGGVRVLSDDVIRWYGVPAEAVDAVAREELAELERREREYRRGRPFPDVRGRIAILVDDGLATGSSMRAAAQAMRKLEPSRVVVAVPVGAPSTCEEFTHIADEIVCARTPEPFSAVGLWYEDFSQTTDDEVRALLDEHRRACASHDSNTL
jgi:putative phosphoribosyl transferase